MAVNATGVLHNNVMDHNCRKNDFVAFLNALSAPHGSTLLVDNIVFHHFKETKAVVIERVLHHASQKGFDCYMKSCAT